MIFLKVWREKMNNEYPVVLVNSLQDSALDYEELGASVKQLGLVHARLESQIELFHNPLAKGLAKLKRALGAKPKYSVEEILRMQLEIIRRLRRTMELQSVKTRTRLEHLVDYSEEVDGKIENSMEYRLSQKPEIEQLERTLAEESKQLQKEDKSKKGYFAKEHAYKRARRDLSEKHHQYDLATEAVIDFTQQEHYLEVQEDLIRNTVHTSERLAEKTKRVESQIAVIRGTYDAVIKQQKLYIALYQALHEQRVYIQGLDQILMIGRSTLSQIAARSQTLNGFYDNPDTEGLRDSIADENYDRREENEFTLEDHINDKDDKLQ